MEKRLEETLKELQSVKSALDAAAIVAITDKFGTIVHVNDRFCEISKYSRQELIGQNHRIIKSGYHAPEFYKNLWSTIRSGKIWEGEICNRAKDASLYWVNTSIVPFLDDAGNPYKYVSIRYDITSRKHAEAQIMQQDRLASIGLLASSLAHEIGTPLGVIRGRAELITMHSESRIVNENAKIIEEQIDRVSKLVNSLLNLARGEETPTTTAVSVAEVVRDVTDLIGHEFPTKNISLINQINEKAVVMAESGPLHQVLLNLLVNGLHAIESVPERQNHKIVLTSMPTLGGWRLAISDTGCGIPASHLNEIFQPFFTTKAIGKGTGLGLATCFRIISSWGGRISVASEEGVGTTFSIDLPGPFSGCFLPNGDQSMKERELQ